MKFKTDTNIILAFFMLFFSAFATADTITKVNIRGQVANTPSPQEPVSFQLASAPGVWIYTDNNRIASIVVGMAAVTGGNIQVDHAYDADTGVHQISRINAGDGTAGGVQSIILWDNNSGYYLPDTMGINFTYSLPPQYATVSCATSSAEQAALVTRALFSHLPLKASAYQSYIWSGGQLQLSWFCRIYI